MRCARLCVVQRQCFGTVAHRGNGVDRGHRGAGGEATEAGRAVAGGILTPSTRFDVLPCCQNCAVVNCGAVTCSGKTAFSNGMKVPLGLDGHGRLTPVYASITVPEAAAYATHSGDVAAHDAFVADTVAAIQRSTNVFRYACADTALDGSGCHMQLGGAEEVV